MLYYCNFINFANVFIKHSHSLHILPADHYCPEGCAAPNPCDAGTYADETQFAVCLDCPAGFFCTHTTVTPESCPAGESVGPLVPE